MRRPVRAGGPVSRIAPGILPAAAIPTLAYLGAPWWAIALVVLGAMIAAALVRVVDRILPHESPDLRGWWDDLWRHWAPRRTPSRPQLPPGLAAVHQRRPVDSSPSSLPREPPGRTDGKARAASRDSPATTGNPTRRSG